MSFPFSDCEDFFHAELENAVPFTIVNSRPLEGTSFIAPFVRCPRSIALKALEFGRINSSDVLIDLGCGDGVILNAAKDIGCKMIGVELDPHLYKECIRKYPSIDFLEMDMFKVDLFNLKATALILYLLPLGLKKLREITDPWLEASIMHRLITINYQIPDQNYKNVTEFETFLIYEY